MKILEELVVSSSLSLITLRTPHSIASAHQSMVIEDIFMRSHCWHLQSRLEHFTCVQQVGVELGHIPEFSRLKPTLVGLVVSFKVWLVLPMYCVVGVDKDILEGLGICPGHLGVIKWSIYLCSLCNRLWRIPGKIFAPSAQRTSHKFSAEHNNQWSCDRAPVLGQAWFAASATCAPVTFEKVNEVI